jgi:3D (Asp-Asp-Asp) domain-containing protein
VTSRGDGSAPPLRAARRKRRQRTRIALEVLLGGAAIWFVANPRHLPTPRVPQPDTDTLQSISEPIDTNSAGVAPARTKTAQAPVGDFSAAETPPDAPKSRVLPRLRLPTGRLFRSIEERARAHERVAVSITAYCLQGITRSGRPVRDGIIAVDRALFPLGRNVDLFLGGKPLGRYRADDTGGVIRGARIDLWMDSCSEAKRFGRRRGYAQLVPRDQ